MSGRGTPLRSWYSLHQTPPSRLAKSAPLQSRIRVELSLLLKSKLRALKIPTSGTSGIDQNIQGIEYPKDSKFSVPRTPANEETFGWTRGECKIRKCDCKFYLPETPQGGACQNCTHWPAQHASISETEPKFAPSIELDSEELETSKKPLIHAESTIVEITKVLDAAGFVSQGFAWEINPKKLKFLHKLPSSTMAFVGEFNSQQVLIKIANVTTEIPAERWEKQFNLLR
jgi:hypothetical protein